jgi:hypothetical protein
MIRGVVMEIEGVDEPRLAPADKEEGRAEARPLQNQEQMAR